MLIVLITSKISQDKNRGKKNKQINDWYKEAISKDSLDAKNDREIL